jgi:uncharacterized integral membrane protein (TIGR00697 family)
MPDAQAQTARQGESRERRLGYRYYDLIMVLFVSVLLTSNIASSAKIVDWGISIGPLPLAFDAGTLLFPISYIFGDVLTEVYGYRRSRRVIWAGFGAAALMAFTLWLVSILPGEAVWSNAVGDEAYQAVLGGVSNGGIIIASLIAYFAGEFSNSYVMARMKVMTRGRWLWTRTIGSTLVGELVDTTLFIVIASLFGVFSWAIALTLIVTNYIFKVGIEALMTPVTYQIIGLLKRTENEDYYDYDTDFNPFRLNA